MPRLIVNQSFTAGAFALFLIAGTYLADDTVRAQTAPARPIDVTVVKYSQLGAAVKEHKGKVVVVDLWQLT